MSVTGVEVLHDDGVPGGAGGAEPRHPLRQPRPQPQVHSLPRSHSRPSRH